MIPLLIADWFKIITVSVAFAAGSYVYATKKLMKDVNGLGAKYGRIVALLILWSDTEEKRQQVSDVLCGKEPHKK